MQSKINAKIISGGIVFDASEPAPKYRANNLFTKEPDTIQWLDNFLQENETFYDIGSNVGVFALYAAKKRGANVIAFEPEASNYNILNKNIFYNRLDSKIIAINIALTDINKMSYLYLSKIKVGASGHSFDANIDYKQRKYKPVFKQGVLGMSLDYVIEQFNLPFPNHIKIDVDGNEHKIINGMKKCLSDRRLKSVAIELNLELDVDKHIIERINSYGFIRLLDETYINKRYIEIGSTYNLFFIRNHLETQ
jgi:FkbM family methyltransferase